MSLDIAVYGKEIPENIVSQLMQRLNAFDMDVEVHPGFRFKKETDEGFVPFKFILRKPHHEILKNKVLISGFELFIENFNPNDLIEKPKKTFGWLLSKKNVKQLPDARLSNCNRVVYFVWRAADTFEARFATLVSSIFAELCNGVYHYPADDIWYSNEGLANKTFQEIVEYENALPQSSLVFHEFEGWS